MSDIRIERNVPPPRRDKYRWREMKPGNSFVVKTLGERDSALRIARYQGIKTTSEKLPRGKGYRLWMMGKP